MKFIYSLGISVALLSCSNAQTETEQTKIEKTTTQQVISTTVDPSTFQKNMTEANAVILDVRTAGEYETGHISGALQADWTNQTQFSERIQAIDKNAPVYIYCLGGGRSSAAQNYLIQNGFTKVINLRGGINAWNQANLPTEGVQNVKQITLKEYEVSIPKKGIVLVDFSAEWCPPCKKVEPLLKDIETKGTQIIRFDGGTQKELCNTLKISGFPTLILYKDGKEVKRHVGLITAEELAELIK